MNKTKTKKLEAISEDLASEFKYTDHLVNDPLSIGDFTIGKNVVAGSNLRRINTITAIVWNDYKKKEKKLDWATKYSTNTIKTSKLKKVNPNFIPYTQEGPGIEYSKISNVVFGNGDSIPHPTEDVSNRPYRHHALEELHDQRVEIKSVIVSRNTRIDLFISQGLTNRVDLERNLLSTNIRTLEEINKELNYREAENSLKYNLSFEEEGIKTPEDWEISLKEVKEKLSKVLEEIEPKKLSYFEKLRSSVDSFVYNFGGNPSIIKGYIIEGEIITDNMQLEALLRSGNFINWENIRTILKVFNIEDNRIVSKIKLSKVYRFCDVGRLDFVIPLLPVLIKFKLTNSKNSNNFFITDSNNKVRNELKENPYNLNWRLEQVNISRNKTKHSTYIVIVEHPETTEDIKFTLSDCSFTNKSIIGYNPPMDKTIKIGSIVKVKDSKLDKYSIRVNNNAEVISIRINPSSKKISKECNNKRMDIVSIRLHSKERTLNIGVYAQDLKFIEHKKKEQNVNANIKKETEAQQYKDLKSQIEDFLYTSQPSQSNFQYANNIWSTSTGSSL